MIKLFRANSLFVSNNIRVTLEPKLIFFEIKRN